MNGAYASATSPHSDTQAEFCDDLICRRACVPTDVLFRRRAAFRSASSSAASRLFGWRQAHRCRCPSALVDPSALSETWPDTGPSGQAHRTRPVLVVGAIGPGSADGTQQKLCPH
jgi:hypothetical protein